MINLILVRHGDCEGKGLYIGRGTDCALTLRGQKEILGITESLESEFKSKKIDAIYASPMLRTLESAHLISESFKIPVVSVPGLEEIDFGKWEGHSYSQLLQKFPEEFPLWIDNPRDKSPPGGESLMELKERVLKVLPFSLSVNEKETEKNIIIISHRGPIAIILLELLGLDLDKFWNFSINRGSKSRVNLYPRFNELHYLNFTAVP